MSNFSRHLYSYLYRVVSSSALPSSSFHRSIDLSFLISYSSAFSVLPLSRSTAFDYTCLFLVTTPFSLLLPLPPLSIILSYSTLLLYCSIHKHFPSTFLLVLPPCPPILLSPPPPPSSTFFLTPIHLTFFSIPAALFWPVILPTHHGRSINIYTWRSRKTFYL